MKNSNSPFRLHTVLGLKCVLHNGEYIIIKSIKNRQWSVLYKDTYVNRFGRSYKGSKWREEKRGENDIHSNLFDSVIAFLEQKGISIEK